MKRRLTLVGEPPFLFCWKSSSPQERDACGDADEARTEAGIEDAAGAVFDVEADGAAIVEHGDEIDGEILQMDAAVNVLVVFAIKTVARLQRPVAVEVEKAAEGCVEMSVDAVVSQQRELPTEQVDARETDDGTIGVRREDNGIIVGDKAVVACHAEVLPVQPRTSAEFPAVAHTFQHDVGAVPGDFERLSHVDVQTFRRIQYDIMYPSPPTPFARR